MTNFNKSWQTASVCVCALNCTLPMESLLLKGLTALCLTVLAKYRKTEIPNSN